MREGVVVDYLAESRILRLALRTDGADADGYPYATRVPQTKAAGDGGVKDG